MFYTIPSLVSTYPYTVTYYNKKDLCIFTVIAFIAILIKSGNLQVRKKGFSTVALFHILIVTLTFLVCMLVYPAENFFTLYNKYYFYSAILLFYVLEYLYKRYPGYYEFFLNTIVIIGVGYAIFMIYSKLVYISTGKYVFDTTVQFIQKRSGELRLARPADFISFATILSFSCATKSHSEKKRKCYFLFTAVMFFAIVYVTQTRIYELAILVSCVFGYLWNENNRSKKLWIFAVIVCSGVAMIPTILSFFGSFTRAEDAAGTLLRFSGYGYYLKRMFNNGVIGLGFTSLPIYSNVLSGPYLMYNLSDTGYVGFIGVFGLLGIIFLALLIYKLYINWMNVDCKRYPENKILTIFVMITSISVIFNDPQRAFMLPIYLAIFEYTYMTSCNRV